jgi:hypothetical protein
MGFWSILLTAYGLASFIIGMGYAWSGGTWAAVPVLVASFLAPATASVFKAAFFVGHTTMRIVTAVIAITVLAFVYWLARGFEANLLGLEMSGVTWIVIGVAVGYWATERGDSYYYVDPATKAVKG